MSDLLAGLTAERLEELAGYMDGPLVRIPRDYWPEIAAALRAVAGAERAMVASYRAHGYDDVMFAYCASEIFTCRPGSRAEAANITPTLLSALGAVGAEEKHDG